MGIEVVRQRWIEPNYEDIELSPEKTELIRRAMNHLFNPPITQGPIDATQEDKLKRLVSSKYHRITPEPLPKPMLGQRIRVFRRGFNPNERAGGIWLDHSIGVARTYINSRTHYIAEVYFGNRSKTDRFMYKFIPLDNLLKTATETSGQSELSIDANDQKTDIVFGDADIFLEWMREVYKSQRGPNRYNPKMRGGRMRLIMPELA